MIVGKRGDAKLICGVSPLGKKNGEIKLKREGECE